MTISGRYELENTLGSQNEALPSQISHLINNILENVCFTHVYLILCLGASQKKTLGDSKLPFVSNDTYNAIVLECFHVVIMLGSNERLHLEIFSFSPRFTVNNC